MSTAKLETAKKEEVGVKIPGLPDGVVAVAIRVPLQDDFVLDSECRITKSSSSWKWPILVVKPAPGWDFMYDILKNKYTQVQRFPKAKKITAVFVVDNPMDEQTVLTAKNLPGFQGFKG